MSDSATDNLGPLGCVFWCVFWLVGLWLLLAFLGGWCSTEGTLRDGGRAIVGEVRGAWEAAAPESVKLEVKR